MDDKIPSSSDLTPMQELSDTLRPAVEQVRAAVPPAEAVDRSLDRAQRLGPPPRRRSRRWLAWSMAASIAAVVLVGYALWPGRTPNLSGQPEQVALDSRMTAKPEPHKEQTTNAPSPEELEKWNESVANDDAAKSISLENPIKPAGDVYTTDPAKRDQAMPRRPADAPKPNTPVFTNSTSKPSSTGGGGSTSPTATPPADKAPQTGREAPPVEFPQPAPVARPGEPKDARPGTAEGKGTGGRGGQQGQIRDTAGDEKAGKDKPESVTAALNKMPEKDRKKAVKELDRVKKELATSEREVLRLRSEMERGTIDPKVGKEAEQKVRDIRNKLTSLETQIFGNDKSGGKPGAKGPQVWHRDRSRPTFARVYVGDGNALELVSLQVSVTLDGPRARTVVDHIFRNPHNRQLEGTFEYPLPAGASPSYFAMFLGQTRDTMPVRFGRRGDSAPLPADALARLTPAELVKQVDTTDWGRLQEARIVSKEKALETYEEIVRGRIDPALLEYSGGNTFSGRVFPIPAKGYNRVILAYEETMPVAEERMLYRFPLPGRKLNDLQFTLQAKAMECLKPSFLPKGTSKDESNGRLTFARRWKDSTPEGEILFACTPADPMVQALSGRQGDNGPRYLYARLRPQLKSVAKGRGFASHAVFLLDTSLSEHPDRFDVSMKLLRRILEDDSDIKRFNVLTFNTGAAWLDSRDFFENTPAGRARALKKLDGLVLEGATDISCALDKLAEPGFDFAAGTNLNVFLLSDGHITWGKPDVAALVARFEKRCHCPTRFHCYRTGLGEENTELFEALTRRGGGVFQCFGEDEVKAAAQAHRNQCMKVKGVRFVGGPQASDILVSGRRAAVYPGGELVVAARFQGTGRATVIVEGEFDGKPMVQEFPLEIRSTSELAPRAWAEVAVASLLALHDSNLDSLVTAYCQQFGIVSRVASFLVLENEADYKRLNLEEERGKTLAGDLGAFLSEAWTRLAQGTPAGKEFERFLSQVDKRVNLLGGGNGAHVKRMLGLLKEDDFELPASSVRGGLLYARDAAGYLGERERDRRNVGVYLKEARRRADDGDVDAAVRVLSSIIEEHPSRGDALRLVGYRLLDLNQPAQAARLFGQVQKQRPFEPHSYRDLAHALEASGRYGWAAVNYEAVLAGAWHNRFRQELKTVAMEEYAHMMQEAIRKKAVSPSLANHFGERLEQMARPQPKSDLRVTISWNTDATDVDLWVIEPDSTKCFYSYNRTRSGGELSQDQTQGYGPERYQIAKAQPGVYTVIVHYFRPNPNLLGGETHVNVSVTRFAGTPQEKVERHTVILKRHDEQVEVCKIKF